MIDGNQRLTSQNDEDFEWIRGNGDNPRPASDRLIALQELRDGRVGAGPLFGWPSELQRLAMSLADRARTVAVHNLSEQMRPHDPDLANALQRLI